MPTKQKSSKPWKRANPRKRPTKLSAKSKRSAKAAAKRGGRRYPNLVDNMRAGAKQRKRSERS